MKSKGIQGSQTTWVLLAIIFGGGENGASIDSIISAADYVNHAILKYEEYRDGIRYLLQNKIIYRNGAEYRLSKSIIEKYLKLKSNSIRNYWEISEKIIRECKNKPEKTPNNTDPIISIEEYDRVVRSYLTGHKSS